jgi:hypothetical protein
MWDEPITTNEKIFSDETYKCPLYVPIGTKDKYDNTVPWYRFNNIVEKELSDVKVNVAGGGDSVSVYNLQGVLIFDGLIENVRLTPGIYVVRSADGVNKIVIK